MVLKLYLFPTFAGEDNGEGGVRRVVDAQREYLTKAGVRVVASPGDADVLASHIETTDEILRRFPDKPLVAHIHGLYWSEYEWDNWAYKANDKVMQLCKAADVITAPSNWVANTVRRHLNRDTRVIPHGVEIDKWAAPKTPGDYVLWNKTRTDPVCDATAVNKLAALMPETQFVSTFAEGGPNITTTGRLPFDKAKLLIESAGVYLCTSRETFGIGTLEAMAASVPIVGYDYGGQSEFVRHGVDGWLVPPGDIDGLAEGVRWALANRKAAGRAARETAKAYTWENACEQYAVLYHEVAEEYAAHEINPRVSIVVTAYNLEKYLPETLASVAAQDGDDWECIVVDDDSPDKCGEIADNVAAIDPRFSVIHNKKNAYLAEARNIAIRKARGRYILPLDADDMLAPGTVQTLADALDIDRQLDVAYGNVVFTKEDGELEDYGLPGRTQGHSGWPVSWDASKQLAGYNLLPYASMFRKAAWKQVGGYRRRLKTAEDADFWTRLASYGYGFAYATTRDTLVYRNRPNSMSRANDKLRAAYTRWYPWIADPAFMPAGSAGNKAVSLLDPVVAIIVPVGPGHEQLVQDAVDSVEAQSYRRWEVIVVNDSGEELTELPQWVRVIQCDARDPAQARNLGVEATRCPMYLPLDADDYLQPDALQWLLTAQYEANADVVYSDFFEDPEDEGHWQVYNLPDYDCQKLITHGALHSVTALTKKEVWKKVGGYRQSLGWEDWDFQLATADAKFCTVRLAAPLFTYRKHTGKRASYDEAGFELRKNQILARWDDYFSRRKAMGCGCGGAVNPRQQVITNTNRNARPTEDALLVEYVGAKAGSTRYKGVSGNIYQFANGDAPKWVLAKDVPLFASLNDFRILAPQAEAAKNLAEPILA